MKTFFDDMPREIEEAALVEGCSRWRVFTRITLPMMRAPLASAALFVFILNWSDYLIALLLTVRIATVQSVWNHLDRGTNEFVESVKTIKRGARIGVNVTILPRVTIGEYALVGAGSVVTKDVPPYAVVYGNPARVATSVNDIDCPLHPDEKAYVDGLKNRCGAH